MPHLNPDWFCLSATGLPRLSSKRGRYIGIVVAVVVVVAVAVAVVVVCLWMFDKSLLSCEMRVSCTPLQNAFMTHFCPLITWMCNSLLVTFWRLITHSNCL